MLLEHEHEHRQLIRDIAASLPDGFEHLAFELRDIKYLTELPFAVTLVSDAGFNQEAEELKYLHAELQSQQEK